MRTDGTLVYLEQSLLVLSLAWVQHWHYPHTLLIVDQHGCLGSDGFARALLRAIFVA